jgi:phosphatidylglycerophosphatase A
MTRIAVFVCSFGYIGFFPFAPGTVGSAAGLVLFAVIRNSGLPYLDAVLIVVLFIAGVVFTPPCEEDLRCTDPGPIVIDEVMGMLVTLFMIPVGWVGLLVGFLLFRALDVAKPFPARRLERMPGGYGVMLDDAMAGIYANLLLRGAHYVAPGWLS